MGASEQGGAPTLAVSITVIRGPDVGTKYAMVGPKVVLGRKRGEFLVRDREASGIHASIERTPDGRFILRDLGSTNGTFLDGRRITATEIRPGQQIKLGANYLLFTATEESASDTTRHASGEISGQMLVPPPPEELVFGRTAISAPEPMGRSASPALPTALPPGLPTAWPSATAPSLSLPSPSSPPLAAPFDGDLGEPDLSGLPTTRAPLPPQVPPQAAPHAAPAAAHPWRKPAAPAPPSAPMLAPPPVATPPAPTPAPPPSQPSADALPPAVEPSVYGVYLLVERGKDRGKVFPVNRQVTVLGRSGTEILIDDPDISRRHAALDIQGQGNYILRDLASTNGTLLNGVRIQTEGIQANDKIRMGSTTIKLLVGDARVAPELARVQAGPPV